MSNPINPNLKPNLQVPMGVSSTAVSSAALPNVDTDKIQKDVNGNPLVKNVSAADNPLVMVGTGVATWAALIALMNKINDGCKTKNGTNVLNKIRDFGNKINDRIIGHSFFKSKTFDRIKINYAEIKEFFAKKVVEKFDFLKTLFRTPTVPKNSQVLTMGNGTEAEVATAAAQFFDKYVQGPVVKGQEFLHGKDAVKLHKLGFVKDPKNPTHEEIAEFERLKNPKDKADIDRILKICEKNAGETFEVSKGLKIPFTQKYLSDFLPFTEKLFKREVHFSEFANKLKVLTGADATAKGLGKFLPKAYLRNIQAITFGLDGSKLGMAMQAFFLTSTILQTAKAEKGDKFKTFMENLFSNQAMYLTMALSIRWMHKFGGLRYLPLKGDPEKLKEFRKTLEEFDKKANISTYLKKQEAVAKAEKKLQNFIDSKGFRFRMAKLLGRNLEDEKLELIQKIKSAAAEFEKEEAIRNEIGFFESEGQFNAARKLLQLQEKGLEKEHTEEIKQALSKLQEKVTAKAEASEIQEAEKALMTRLTELEHGLNHNSFKGGLKEGLCAPFKWAARLLTVGLEEKIHFIPTKGVKCFKSRMINWNWVHYLKKGAGYPVRFIFFGFVIAPFFSKLAARGSHLIFGRPKHSTILDEEEPTEEKPAEHKLPAPVRGQPGFPLQPQQQAPAAQPASPAINTNKPVATPIKPVAQPVKPAAIPTAQPSRNVVAQPVMQPVGQPAAPAYSLNAPSQQRQVINPAPFNQKAMIESQEPPRTYIPSPAAAKIDMSEEQQKNQRANEAVLRADNATKIAIRTLGK